ncbi:cytochrome P450 [Candidatus Mycobacterium wuenschmannii]|uniref:Cytochrome P450 n=1 Tax=Candidatus Mycobacterium wuenschmannii TaxID=3027808 RepID=A0ABY8W2H4_9MYCO|nr:cytochrome P450 [Candidatus Mycobacterium wuenschmannii]WIM90093.1 cytochrome P450 [Candidatus Mycobacterium wuenschmannii]
MGTRPNIDLTDGAFYADRPRAAYAWMRDHEPVFRDRNGLAAVSTYAAVVEAERNPALFSNAGGIRPDQPGSPMMIDMDDPAHLKRRKLVNAGFTRKRVQDLAESIDTLCDTLIDAVCEKGECDFVRDIAAPLPMAVIGDMLGVRPEQREMFLKWSDDLVTGLSSRVSEQTAAHMVQTFADYSEFTRATLAQRRLDPGEDLISVLVNAEVDGGRLDDDEIVMETLLILIGGDETTRHTLSGGTEQLLRHPEHQRALGDDLDLVPQAVEEMLRWTSPVKNMCRLLTEDTTFHDASLRAGEKVMLLFESANFDESVFDAPEEFDPWRFPNNHIAFGFGSHFCLGNQLARLELSTMLRKLLARLPDLRLADASALPLRPANFVSGLEQMPVVFTPSAPVLS